MSQFCFRDSVYRRPTPNTQFFTFDFPVPVTTALPSLLGHIDAAVFR